MATPTVLDGLDGLKQSVGQHLGYSDWVEITQDQVNRFADATGHHQWIHVDIERAKAGPFGGPIAHGYYTLSLTPVLLEQVLSVKGVKMGVNYGGNKVRFITPVRSGKRVRGRFKLLELIEKRPGQWQQTNEFTVEIEGEDKPALVADWIGLIYFA